jgi:hypothetical protein
MTQYVQAKIETMEQPITAWVLLSVAFLLMCAYAFFVNGAITHIVEAKDMQAEASQLASSIGNLESEYMAAKESLHIEYAQANGFSPSAVNTIYVAKQPLASLSFNK